MAVLRAELRHRAVEAGALPDWSTFAVTGPTKMSGARGRSGFEWRATVRERDVAASASGPGRGGSCTHDGGR